MNKKIISQISLNLLQGRKINLSDELKEVQCPKVKDIEYDLLQYNTKVSLFIELFEKLQTEFLNNLRDMDLITVFAEFAKLFIDAQFIYLGEDNSDIYLEYYSLNKDNKKCIIATINKVSIPLFMDVLKIMHHMNDYLDEEDDNDSKAVREHKRRVREQKLRLRKLNAQNDGIGLFEVISSLCTRSPSYNLLNINELSYYQLIEQFSQLMKIDSWQINMNALTSGNMTEEGQNKIKHYTAKPDD